MLIRSVYSRGTSSSGGTGGGVPLDFRSDFAGMAVDSQALSDISDAGKWTRLGNDSWKTVRDAAGQGLPASLTRYLEHRIFGTQSAENAVLGLTKPSVGGNRYWRMYIRWRMPTAITLPTGSHHPIEPYFGNCPFQWEFRVGANQAGTGTLDIAIEGCAGPGETLQNAAYRWRSSGGVDQWLKNTFYRLEYAFLSRTASDVYGFQARVYNMADVLLADSSTFRNVNGTLANTLQNDAPVYSLAPTFNGVGGVDAGHDGVDCITRMQLGPNGPGSWDVAPNDTTAAGNECYMDVTGVATSTQGWIGAHANGY